eukprot:512217-Prorocentrum_minimum.AAC.1
MKRVNLRVKRVNLRVTTRVNLRVTTRVNLRVTTRVDLRVQRVKLRVQRVNSSRLPSFAGGPGGAAARGRLRHAGGGAGRLLLAARAPRLRHRPAHGA